MDGEVKVINKIINDVVQRLLIQKDLIRVNFIMDQYHRIMIIRLHHLDGVFIEQQMMLAHLRKINPWIKNFKQIRASVITAWLKQYDLRKVQYLVGHKHVCSTEKYKANVINELQEDIQKVPSALKK